MTPGGHRSRVRTDTPHQGWFVLVLAGVLLFVSVMALEAYRAVNAARSVMDATLQEYAGVAAWNFAAQAQDALHGAINGVFNRPAHWYYNDPAAPDPADPAALFRPMHDSCVCSALIPISAFVRDSTGSVKGVDASGAPVTGFTGFAATPAAATHTGMSEFSIGIDGSDTVVIATTRTDPRGRPLTYAFTATVNALVDVVADFAEARPLLPPALIEPSRFDSAATVRMVGGRDSRIVKPGTASAGVVGSAALPPEYGGLGFEVVIPRSLGEELIVGDTPSNRVRLLTVLFVLTALVLGVALHMFRRGLAFAQQRTNFAIGVSHELRTPLAQIRLFLESVLLGRTVDEAQRRRYIEIAYEEAGRLTHLVNDNLRFSQLERGSIAVNRRTLDLGRLISESVAAFRSIAGKKKVELRYLGSQELTVAGDPDLLRHALFNLFDNALKYGPESQTITVDAERMGERIRFWVEDEGPGIQASERQDIWEAYRRGSQTDSTTAGTGVGLAVVRNIVRIHDGSVWVEDGRSGGSRFIVDLPVAAPESGQRSDG